MTCRNDDGGWDTPDVARMLLRSTIAAHKSQLEQLPASSQPERSLADVAAGHFSVFQSCAAA